ncbi:hypothetical protein B2J93_492 [Marssonina coronariae]|uniref:Uncharacterized protein n=1 Tax=Diplocarpon coronariae TaxID=2795749 RepID=A0A218Z1H3_9HELO|nr:hypothetical protein B2J93_492 [Marssonina coronariae]
MPPQPDNIGLASTSHRPACLPPPYDSLQNQSWEVVAIAESSPREPSETRTKHREESTLVSRLRRLMEKGAGAKALEIGVETFHTNRPSLVDRFNALWNATSCDPLPASRSRFHDRSSAGICSREPKIAFECRGCCNLGDSSGEVRHDGDVCRLPVNGFGSPTLLELRSEPGGGSLHPLSGQMIQRGVFVHERASGLVAPLTAATPAKSKIIKTKNQRQENKQSHPEKEESSWRDSCIKKNKEAENQGEVNLGCVQGLSFIGLSSEESLVNITVSSSAVLSPQLEDHMAVTVQLREENKLDMFMSDIVDIDTIAKNNKGPSRSKSRHQGGVPQSLSQAMDLSKEILPELDVCGALRLEGKGPQGGQIPGTLRAEPVAEDGFFDVELPTEEKMPVVVVCSRVRYLGLALREAMDMPLLKMPHHHQRSKKNISVGDSESEVESYKTTRSSDSLAENVGIIDIDEYMASPASPTLSFGRARSFLTDSCPAVLIGRPSSTISVADMVESSLSGSVKKLNHAADFNSSYLSTPSKQRGHSQHRGSKDGHSNVSQTSYPALDTSATSPEFGFHQMTTAS